jgi:hypothetical protein
MCCIWTARNSSGVRRITIWRRCLLSFAHNMISFLLIPVYPTLRDGWSPCISPGISQEVVLGAERLQLQARPAVLFSNEALNTYEVKNAMSQFGHANTVVVQVLYGVNVPRFRVAQREGALIEVCRVSPMVERTDQECRRSSAK